MGARHGHIRCSAGDYCGHAAFGVDANTGIVTVNDRAALDYETAQTCTITVRATSQDTSTADTTFSVAVTDVNENPVGAPSDSDNNANTVAENAANGDTAGLPPCLYGVYFDWFISDFLYMSFGSWFLPS